MSRRKHYKQHLDNLRRKSSAQRSGNSRVSVHLCNDSASNIEGSAYDVLDHDPTHDDIRMFLRRLHTALSVRDLPLFGVTTDGSSLYPTPLAEVFGDVPHQICTFHIMAEVNKAVL